MPWLLEGGGWGPLFESASGEATGALTEQQHEELLTAAGEAVEASAAEVLGELYERRALFYQEATFDAQVVDFGYHLRGGQWTRRHRGDVVDSARGMALRSPAAEFCRRAGLSLSSTYSLALYGHEDAVLAARFWCHRLQFLYNEYLGGRPLGEFSDAVLGLYTEPPEVGELMARAPPALAERLRAIRALRPRA